jgi:hypothetical protein
MARTTSRNARNAQAAAVVAFDLAAWSVRMDTAALQFTSAGKAMLDLIMEARGKVEADTVREKLQHAFASAFATTYGVTFDEACKAKSVMNRVSDGMAVFKAETMPGSLPGNLQQAAAACRKANPKERKSSPRQPVAPKVDAKDVNPLALLQAALEALRKQAADNQPALELIGELVDLAGDLAEALASDAGETQAA